MWPTAYYIGVKGEKPPRGVVSHIVHVGKKVVGVLMKDPGPDPTKAYESWSVAQDAVDRVGDFGTTD